MALKSYVKYSDFTLYFDILQSFDTFWYPAFCLVVAEMGESRLALYRTGSWKHQIKPLYRLLLL